MDKEWFWLGRYGRRFKNLHLKQDPQMSPLETWWLERPWSQCWCDSADPPLTHPMEQACLLSPPSSVPCESKSPSFWEKLSANLEWFQPTPEQKASLPQSLLSAFCGWCLTKLPLEFNSRNSVSDLLLYSQMLAGQQVKKALPIFILLLLAGYEFVMN